ncbi:hypothetical protein L873DRAFT_1797843 [Choiromyces venosus 120613-1]|uniref:General transcription and DNA repair factor IIH subunit TFB5 n=1 Tax=Choiromyces venosus 120613-1 TaxID=1336337 RepID=A0A3N4KHY2_9PEZI|nr:hypothetical protein L873DRAFT_1797843 [Choiromyces venosus 120613-1]
MPRAVKGVLIECDPSIKAIILKIDKDSGHGYIVEDLDDETLVVKEPKLAELKSRLLRGLVCAVDDDDHEGEGAESASG